MSPARTSPCLPVDRLSRRERPVYTLSADCPCCSGVFTLRQMRDGHRFYIACTRRPCDYTTAYAPVLEQLRDRIVRLEAEVTFNRMQSQPVAEGREVHP